MSRTPSETPLPGMEILVTRKYITDPEAPDKQERKKTIEAEMVMEGLEYMVANFLSPHCHWIRDARMWSILHRDQEVRSWTDYILGT